MAVKTREEILESVKEILGDNTDDNTITFLEDITDTITDLEDKGYKLPCGLIPMCEVVNKLNININYLQNMVRMEIKWYL